MGRSGAASLLLLACVARGETTLPVSVSVAPEAPCVSLESLSAQLAREGMTITDSGALDVDVSASAPGVRLRARRQDDGRLLVRSIPARGGKCEGVERALVMLIREWARASQLITTPVAKVEVPVLTPVRPKAKVAVEAPAPEPVVEPDAGVTEPEPAAIVVVESQPVDAGPLPLALPPKIEAPAPPVVIEVPWQVKLAVAGGFSAASTKFVVPAGSVVLDVGRSALGASLDGTIEGAAVLTEGQGEVAVTFQWITLSARWRFTFLNRLSLDLGLGVRGSHLSAVASGFTTNRSADLLSIGPAAIATFWFRIVGPLQLMVRASAALRHTADNLNVVDGGPTFPVSAAQLGVVAGLGVAWP